MNFHSWRHIGHMWLVCCECSHFMMQCMWKQCEHCPHTNGQSSPGILQSGQLASNGILHMPQLSSFAIHRQVATPVQLFIVTFISIIGVNLSDDETRRNGRPRVATRATSPRSLRGSPITWLRRANVFGRNTCFYVVIERSSTSSIDCSQSS